MYILDMFNLSEFKPIQGISELYDALLVLQNWKLICNPGMESMGPLYL